MSLIGRLAGLYVAPDKGAVMQAHDRAMAEAGQGLVGDRYHAGIGTFSQRAPLVPGARALSIIDTRTLMVCCERLGRDIEPACLRRNLLIETDTLHDLVGCELVIGDARVVLTGRCPPCGYLTRLLGADMRAALHGLGGMRAAIVTSGELGVGDSVQLATVGQRRLPD